MIFEVVLPRIKGRLGFGMDGLPLHKGLPKSLDTVSIFQF